MVGSKFSLKVLCSTDEIYKVEGFVEDICDYHNVFNFYFGNILVATCEYFSFLANMLPGKEMELYSHLNESGIVIGYKIGKNYNEVAPYYQKGISGYIESEDISEDERSLLSAALLSDDIILNSAEQNVELIFNIKTEAGHRGKKISKYIENLTETSTVRAKRGS